MSTVVAIKLSAELHSRLKEIGAKESRGLNAQVLFFLETCASASQQEPRLRLLLEAVPEQPLAKHHSKFVLEDELYDYYFHWACRFGMRIAPFLRMVLLTAIRCYERLAPARVMEKEEFVGVLLEQARNIKPMVQ